MCKSAEAAKSDRQQADTMREQNWLCLLATILVSKHLEIKVGTKVCKTGQPDRQKDKQNLWLRYLCPIWTFIPVLGGQGVGVRGLNPLSRHVFHE